MSSREEEVEITKKIAPYAPEEELGIYKATRWTWRRKQEAVMKAGKILDEEKGLMEMDLIDFQVQQMLACIKPPEGLTWDMARINELDTDVGDILLALCHRVNGTTLSERTDFLKRSDSAEGTPG
jgi:hypothetical protein